MTVHIVRIDKSLPLPEYKTEGAAAFDFYARTDATLRANEVSIIPTNLIIEVPKGHVLFVSSRSSGPKKGYIVANGPGIVDQDYHGPKDEIGVILYNVGGKDITIARGERIAQGTIVPIERAEWEEVGQIKEESRGGFGSTGE